MTTTLRFKDGSRLPSELLSGSEISEVDLNNSCVSWKSDIQDE